MEQEELNSILQVIENPIRRRIIKRLSQEPAYCLQLSKELDLGQPLVAKHLGIMEEAGLVTSAVEFSPAGPKRKRYSLTKSVSITMDLAPSTYVVRGVALGTRPRRKAESQAAGQLRKRIGSALDIEDEKKRLSQLSEVLDEVDERTNDLEAEHAELVRVRNQAMEAASEIANKLDELDKRRVLFYILDEHDREATNISESLKLREVTVREILDELEREFFG